MYNWIKSKCFDNLELVTQKNNLLLFLLLPIFVLGETCVLLNLPFYSEANLSFLFALLFIFLTALICKQIPALSHSFKYIMMTCFLLLGFYQLYIFNFTSQVYQSLYVLLVLSLIYLNGRLTLFTGLSMAAFTIVAFIFWRDTFFPYIQSPIEISVPIILMLETTLVLWGGTFIGTRFNHYISSSQYMEQLLQQIQQQFSLIQEQNNTLTKYTKQVERLTLLEERNRILRELQFTIGDSLTSILAEMEALSDGQQEDQERLNKLIDFSRDYLQTIKQKFAELDIKEQETVSDGIQKVLAEAHIGGDTDCRVKIIGKEYEMNYSTKLSIFRCFQELLTFSLRARQPHKIDVDVYFLSDELIVMLEDEAEVIASWEEEPEFVTISERLQELKGELRISQRQNRVMNYSIHVPNTNQYAYKEMNVLIVVNQALLGESIQRLLDLEPDIHVTQMFRTVSEAVANRHENEPDIILFDISKREELEAIQELKEAWPQAKIVVLSPFYDLDYAIHAIHSDVQAYLLKTMLSSNLANIVRIVYSGNTLLPIEIGQRLLENYDQPLASGNAANTGRVNGSSFGLTEKEVKILELLSEGLKYKEIAEALSFSDSTIRNYVSIIYSKLEAENRMQAVKKAKDNAII